ncbi:hypothetical protein ACFL1S_01920 [Pseudomonadota bacterium]
MFAPNSAYRSQVTPARRGRGDKPKACGEWQQKTLRERHATMSWPQRLKRVFNEDTPIAAAFDTGNTVPAKGMERSRRIKRR